MVENVRRAVGKFVELVYRLFVTRKQNEEVQISVEFWKDIVGLQVWKY